MIVVPDICDVILLMKAFVYDPMCAFHVVVRCGWLMPMTRGYDTLVHELLLVEGVIEYYFLKHLSPQPTDYMNTQPFRLLSTLLFTTSLASY